MMDPVNAPTRKNKVIAEEIVPFGHPNSILRGSSMRACPKKPMPEEMVKMPIPPRTIHHP